MNVSTKVHTCLFTHFLSIYVNNLLTTINGSKTRDLRDFTRHLTRCFLSHFFHHLCCSCNMRRMKPPNLCGSESAWNLLISKGPPLTRELWTGLLPPAAALLWYLFWRCLEGCRWLGLVSTTPHCDFYLAHFPPTIWIKRGSKQYVLRLVRR